MAKNNVEEKELEPELEEPEFQPHVTPYMAVKLLLGKRVYVRTTSGSIFVGVLRGVDPRLNLVLENAVLMREREDSLNQVALSPRAVIRGTQLEYVFLLIEEEEDE